MKATLKIRFHSGREERYTAQFEGGGGAGLRVAEFLTNPTLALKTASELLIFPAAAIECISIGLSPEALRTADLSTVRSAERMA